jgi:hypothetical protein
MLFTSIYYNTNNNTNVQKTFFYQNIDGHSPVTLQVTPILLPQRDMKNANAFEQDVFALK